MNILICDDELIIAEYLKEICIELGYKVCAIAGNKLDAIDKIIFHRPNLVLLDINMDEPNTGIELAAYINETIKVPFIFITAFSDADTIGKAAFTNPHAYLVKPIDKNTLKANIQLANHRYSTVTPLPDDVVNFSTDSGNFKVNLAQVRYIEANGNYCEFIMRGGGKELVRISMHSVESTLKDKFIRVHKSFLINPGYITGSSSLRVLLGLDAIPVGRTYKQNLYEYLGKM